MSTSPTAGRLLVLLPGLGAVATTVVAGVELLRGGSAHPTGSWTQLGHLDGRPVRDELPLAPVESLVFEGWDIHGEDGLQVARRSGVLGEAHLQAAAPALQRLRPRPGVFDPARCSRLQAVESCPARTHRERVDALREDIRAFRARHDAGRAVMVFTASTEAWTGTSPAMESLAAFERGLDASDDSLTPTQLYAYAALSEGVPFANGTPNLGVEIPALREYARARGVPTCGKDFKSGQTLLKTALAPALRARLLGVRGWFSTNILGNRDGEVLDDPANFRAKELTKGSVLETILDAEAWPQLYGGLSHKVTIHFYPPRGDAKEGWDNVDLEGWLGYPMQLKVNFLCRDSILAAPLVLDLALLLDAAARAGLSGPQEWLSFFFKSPVTRGGGAPVHDLFEQLRALEAGARALR